MGCAGKVARVLQAYLDGLCGERAGKQGISILHARYRRDLHARAHRAVRLDAVASCKRVVGIDGRGVANVEHLVEGRCERPVYG